ncbi:MAG: FecR family protein, partial [Gammaproteobacteria bacterium]
MKPRVRFSDIIHGLLLIATLLCGFGAIAAEPGVANVTELDGKAFAAISGGAMRTLQMNDKLYQGERVITGRDSELQFKFTDGTTITLGESTIVNVDAYAYRKTAATEAAAEPESESFSMSILRGTVRAFTGLLAKRRPGRVRFNTKVA